MRLPERYKQTIYVANEKVYNSKDFEKPYELRAIVSPKGDSTVFGGGVLTQQNTVEIKIETSVEGIKGITQNSLIWIKRIPTTEPDEEFSDNTHVIVSRDVTGDGWYFIMECQNAGGDNPIL